MKLYSTAYNHVKDSKYILKRLKEYKRINDECNKIKNELITELKRLKLDNCRIHKSANISINYVIVDNECYRINVYNKENWIIVQEKKIPVELYIRNVVMH